MTTGSNNPTVRRRFTMLIGFDAMRARQVGQLFEASFAPTWPAGHSPIRGLTPGDVAVVVKRARLLNVGNHQASDAAPDRQS